MLKRPREQVSDSHVAKRSKACDDKIIQVASALAKKKISSLLADYTTLPSLMPVELVIRCTALLGVFSQPVLALAKNHATMATKLLLYLCAASCSERMPMRLANTKFLSLCSDGWNKAVVENETARRVAWLATYHWKSVGEGVCKVITEPVSKSSWLDLMNAAPCLQKQNLDASKIFEVFIALLRCADVLERDKCIASTHLARFTQLPMVMGDDSVQPVWHDSLWSMQERHAFFRRYSPPIPMTGCKDPDQFVRDVADCPGVCQALQRARKDLSHFPVVHDWFQAQQSDSWEDLLRLVGDHTNKSYPTWVGAPLVLRLQILTLVTHSMVTPCCDSVSRRQSAGESSIVGACALSRRARLTTVLLPDNKMSLLLSTPEMDERLIRQMLCVPDDKWHSAFRLQRKGDKLDCCIVDNKLVDSL